MGVLEDIHSPGVLDRLLPNALAKLGNPTGGFEEVEATGDPLANRVGKDPAIWLNGIKI